MGLSNLPTERTPYPVSCWQNYRRLYQVSPCWASRRLPGESAVRAAACSHTRLLVPQAAGRSITTYPEHNAVIITIRSYSKPKKSASYWFNTVDWNFLCWKIFATMAENSTGKMFAKIYNHYITAGTSRDLIFWDCNHWHRISSLL